jgi:hypothetical protein
MRGAALPVALIVFGFAGLAWYYDLFPDIDTLISLGLACGGAGILYFEGLSKASVVSGPALIAAGSAWALHSHRGVSWLALVPAMFVVVGALMLVARSPRVPERSRRRGAGAQGPVQPV